MNVDWRKNTELTGLDQTINGHFRVQFRIVPLSVDR